MTKYPITAVLCSKNEGHLLEDCFRSISFCDEIIFIDQKSIDESLQIARDYTDIIHIIEPVKAIELVRKKFILEASNEWVLLVDPDERIPYSLVLAINKQITALSSHTLAGVKLPYDYYVGDYKLKGTVWGNQSILRVINRNRVNLNQNIHKSISPKKGFEITTFRKKQYNAVQHLWVENLDHLKSKHNNYLLSEGISMYNSGYRYSQIGQIKDSLKALLGCYIKRAGFRDGIMGLQLSLIFVQYIWGRWDMLRKYQGENEK